MCAGNEKTYDYLIRFLAHMIQKPHEKPGVIITLLGGQVTGKGVFFSLLRAIWPRTFLLVSDIEQVIGRFNHHAESTIRSGTRHASQKSTVRTFEETERTEK
jgi:hypothetical protein